MRDRVSGIRALRARIARGVRFGQPTKLTPQVREKIEQWVAEGVPVKEVAKRLKLAKATIRKAYPRPVLDELRGGRK